MRNSKATSTAHFEHEKNKLSNLENQFFEKDSISDFTTMCNKLSDIPLPSEFLYIRKPESVLFCYISSSSFAHEAVPRIGCAVRIHTDMTFECYLNEGKISSSRFDYLLKVRNRISTITEVTNLLAACKSLCDMSGHSDASQLIGIAHDLLERFVLLAEDEKSSGICGLIKFIAEQLHLCQLSEHAQQYSPGLLVIAFLWHMNSHAMYKRLRELFCLPSRRRLQQLSGSTTVSTSSIDMNYLKTRASTLLNEQKIVLLMIDEVYTASHVELVDGKLVGVTSEGTFIKNCFNLHDSINQK